ncbi:glucuronate isomerase [Agromyces soli]|uniref:Uronate isomerase n=1 Tax=Agromyces soli TaxID=659012 RepID=A0ABY4APW6_9MICO|nr:glucuronate isomerase [Agromyces soli]UOE25211.1 glucuronate isomerase [Agromyces soli]
MQPTRRTHPAGRHPERLLPSEPQRRRIARELYEQVADLPIVSPHGHVPAALLAENRPFENPTELFITPDHYVTRLLHAHGVPLAELGVGAEPLSEEQARRSWRILCEHWARFAGTPMKYWLEDVLVGVFEVDELPDASNANALFDHLGERLRDPAYLPRALVESFNIETLATTDDPLSTLEHHAALRDDPAFATDVIPTLRIEAAIDPGHPSWHRNVTALLAGAGGDDDVESYLAAIAERRRVFARHGAVSIDCALEDARTAVLPRARLAELYLRARRGEATPQETATFRAGMVSELARQSHDDGLVITLHVGSLRDYDAGLHRQYGPDRGCDIPLTTRFAEGLRPLLNEFGHDPAFHLVLFTLDETSWAREIAPLAGFYPSVYAGAPWWFLDEPEAILRYRSAVTGSIGFGKQSGFIDDTRALCSIPARHDMARRLDSAFLSKLVSEHRLSIDEAGSIIRQLSYELPRATFRLGHFGH